MQLVKFLPFIIFLFVPKYGISYQWFSENYTLINEFPIEAGRGDINATQDYLVFAKEIKRSHEIIYVQDFKGNIVREIEKFERLGPLFTSITSNDFIVTIFTEEMHRAYREDEINYCVYEQYSEKGDVKARFKAVCGAVYLFKNQAIKRDYPAQFQSVASEEIFTIPQKEGMAHHTFWGHLSTL